MGLSDHQSRNLIYRWLVELIATNSDSILENPEDASDIVTHWDIAKELYVPSPELLSRIKDYEDWCETGIGENGGNLMEEIAFLAFRSLKGWNVVESYQSYSSQHDLVISGSESHWMILMIFLHLPTEGRTIVIEAKNLKKPVNDQQFSRLCHILQNKFKSTSHLGVFLSRSGATGFKARRALRDSRATQVLFHALTNKFVVVLDHEDILQLKKVGSLPYLLEGKIRDVEYSSDISADFDIDWTKVNLPNHIAKWHSNVEDNPQKT